MMGRDAAVEIGDSKSQKVRRMSYETEPAVDVATLDKPQPPAARFRHLFCYRIDGDLRYISHHDTVRMFQRAIARADLPVKFSEGFNPHSRIQFPLPRPVGIASDAEYVLIDYAEQIDPQRAMEALAAKMPADITLLSAREVVLGEKFLPNFVRYQLQLSLSEGTPTTVDAVLSPSPLWTECDQSGSTTGRGEGLSNEEPVSRNDLLARIAHCNTADSLPATRVDNKHKTKKTIDVRPYLTNVSLKDNAVEFTLRVTTTGTARPAEIAELLGISAVSINHRIRRMEIQWL